MPGSKPVTIELTDVKTKEVVDTLEVDACLVATGRAPYTQVRMDLSHSIAGRCVQGVCKSNVWLGLQKSSACLPVVNRQRPYTQASMRRSAEPAEQCLQGVQHPCSAAQPTNLISLPPRWGSVHPSVHGVSLGTLACCLCNGIAWPTMTCGDQSCPQGAAPLPAPH